MQNRNVELALDRDSLRTARYWVPGMTLLLFVEGVSHLVPLETGRVVFSLLSALVLAALSWMIWRKPGRLEPFRYWVLVPWALPLANIFTHIGPTQNLAVVFSTMALLLCGALLTRTASFAIALPVTAAVQIYSVIVVGANMPAGFLAPLFAIPISILLYAGRRRAIFESVRAHELEEALRAQSAQLSRYRGLARMSGYVAHHFNNIMTGAVVGSSMALETLGDDHPSRMWVELTKDSTEKASAFTSPLARFAGYTGDVQTRVAATEVVNFPFLRDYVPEGIQFSCHVEEDLPPIFGNAVELLDCLLAVIDNAVDAVEQTKEPQVTVMASLGQRDGTAISIADNGEGIPPENRSNVLEPFFTTRDRARSGLGLTYVKGILDKHDGDIRFDSMPDGGTRVTLEFPKAERMQVVT